MMSHTKITNKTQADRGFTLIELLVVMIIIGILAAIAVPVFLSQREKAQATAVKSEIKNFSTVMLGAYDTRYHNANELNTLGASFRTSPNVVLTVVRVDANNYCVAATNSSGAKDGSGIGNAIGLKTAIHTRDRDKTTLVTSSDPGCLYSGPVSTSDGYYDSSGYHAGAVKF